MKVEQLYPLINSITQEALGDSVVLNEDLSNIVDVGDSIIGAMGVDNYVKALTDRIGKVVFVSRLYNGSVPSVLVMIGISVQSLKRLIVKCLMPSQ